MTAKTHIAGGALSAAALIACGQPATPLLIGAVMTGALLPDIDHFNSSIANRNIGTKTLSSLVSLLFGHRGITHTVIFIAVLSAAVYVAGINISEAELFKQAALPLAAGMLSHIILDSFNPGGIMWMWPFKSKKYRLANIRTGSMKENLFFIVISVIVILAVWYISDPESADIISELMRKE